MMGRDRLGKKMCLCVEGEVWTCLLMHYEDMPIERIVTAVEPIFASFL